MPPQAEQEEQESLSQDEMMTTAYVFGGRLCMLGIAQTGQGAIPVACYVPVHGTEDGPVDWEKAPDHVKEAARRGQLALTDKVEREKVKLEVFATVDQARAGDQNAAARLVEIRKRAQAGDPLAKFCYTVALQYTKRSPAFSPGEDSQELSQDRLLPQRRRSHNVIVAIIALGARDAFDPLVYPLSLSHYLPMAGVNLETVVALCDGPALTSDKVKTIFNGLPTLDEQQAFALGCMGKVPPKETLAALPPAVRRAMGAGKCLDCARRMQAMRDGKVPYHKIDKAIAFELE